MSQKNGWIITCDSREEIKDNKAKVTINTDYGVEKLVPVNLILEGTEWKIVSIECPQIEEQKQKEKEQKWISIKILKEIRNMK